MGVELRINKMKKEHTKYCWTVGQIYSYPSKETCIKTAQLAINDGFRVGYLKTITGLYAFQIIDPFERGE